MFGSFFSEVGIFGGRAGGGKENLKDECASRSHIFITIVYCVGTTLGLNRLSLRYKSELQNKGGKVKLIVQTPLGRRH